MPDIYTSFDRVTKTDGATHPARLFTASLSERPLAVPSPLSERGWRGSGLDAESFDISAYKGMDCVAIPSRRGVPEGRGVSHSQSQADNKCRCVALAIQCRCVELAIPSNFFKSRFKPPVPFWLFFAAGRPRQVPLASDITPCCTYTIFLSSSTKLLFNFLLNSTSVGNNKKKVTLWLKLDVAMRG